MLRRIIRLTNNRSGRITRLWYKFGHDISLQGLDLLVLPLIVEDCLKLQHYCLEIIGNFHFRFINCNVWTMIFLFFFDSYLDKNREKYTAKEAMRWSLHSGTLNCWENQLSWCFQVCPKLQKLANFPLRGIKTATHFVTSTPTLMKLVWECLDCREFSQCVRCLTIVFALIGSKESRDLYVKWAEKWRILDLEF